MDIGDFFDSYEDIPKDIQDMLKDSFMEGVQGSVSCILKATSQNGDKFASNGNVSINGKKYVYYLTAILLPEDDYVIGERNG